MKKSIILCLVRAPLYIHYYFYGHYTRVDIQYIDRINPRGVIHIKQQF